MKLKQSSILNIHKTLFSTAIGQKTIHTTDSCSAMLDRVSYFWKLDSQGTNGYRAVVYKDLIHCIKGRITEEQIITKLGKPNNLLRDNLESIYYEYYFFDGKRIPKEADLSKELLTIIFRFDKGNPYLVYVGESHLD